MRNATFYRYELPDGRMVVFEIDDDYETCGSYALETEEATKAAEKWEIERLCDGRLVQLFCQVKRRCGECGSWIVEDSCGGIVIEPDTSKLEEWARNSMEGVS